jgi:hypothetical protein
MQQKVVGNKCKSGGKQRSKPWKEGGRLCSMGWGKACSDVPRGAVGRRRKGTMLGARGNAAHSGEGHCARGPAGHRTGPIPFPDFFFSFFHFIAHCSWTPNWARTWIALGLHLADSNRISLAPPLRLGHPYWTSSTPLYAPIVVVCMGLMSSSDAHNNVRDKICLGTRHHRHDSQRTRLWENNGGVTAPTKTNEWKR